MKLWSQSFGYKFNIPLLLISGANTNSRQWPENLINGFVENGFRVIVYDNRDICKSKWSTPLYTLDDMAKDAISVLQDNDLDSAHIIGCSMGGMIAQILAVNYSKYARSMTAIMSTPATGFSDCVLPEPTKEWFRAYEESRFHANSGNYKKSIESLIEAQRGSKYDVNYETAHAVVEQGFNPDCRHGYAIMASPHRKDEVKKIKVPSLVIHGDEDPLLHIKHGQYLAENIPNCKFKTLEGVGHELPNELSEEIVSDITNFIFNTI